VTRPAILIVDDEDDAREATALVLSGAGYDAFEAVDGRQALDRLEEMPRPAVVLLDLMMPVMDGVELIEELTRRGELAGLNVLLVSASDAVRAAHPVARQLPFLRKPFTAARLLDFLESHGCDAARYSQS
jgi:CheY-like chemotaxis protein